MRRLSSVFASLKAKREGALIAYVMCGDPSVSHTPRIVDALVAGGADIIELGIPFSDPVADGPIIQAASQRALSAGTTPMQVLRTVQEIKRKHDIPVVLLTYLNPINKMGLKVFMDKASSAGVDGTIVPDLPVEEGAEYKEEADRFNIDTIFLVTPATSDERLKRIASLTSGFLYLVSLYGVTGVRGRLQDTAIGLVKRSRRLLDDSLNLAAGFGISTPTHVRSILSGGADGVIVGSLFVQQLANRQANFKRALLDIRSTASSLKEATSLTHRSRKV